jgi:hypothetical protein
MVPLRADAEMQARIEELADKCTEGRLTPQEREAKIIDYEPARLILKNPTDARSAARIRPCPRIDLSTYM